MRKFDLIVQTLTILLALILALKGFIETQEIPVFYILCIQLILGPWQFFGSFIHWFKNLKNAPSLFKTLISSHFIISVLYLSLTLLLRNYFGNSFFLGWVTVIPWLLAFLYYTICYLRFRRHTKYHSQKGGFLPHLKL